MSQRELAAELGVSAMSLTRWERDGDHGPGPDHAVAYLAALTRMAGQVVADA